jgi:hypothetical protein
MSTPKKAFRLVRIAIVLPLFFAGLALLSGQSAYAQTTGSISGSITAYTGGAAIPGVTVQVYDTGWNYVKSGTTDVLGNYSISNLAVGSYYLHTSNSLGYIDQYHPGSFYYNARIFSAPVSVSSGTNTAGVNFSLRSGSGSISGKVSRDSDGQALSGINVFVYYTDSYHLCAASTTTDASGNYSIPGLAPNNYYVETSNTSGYIDEYYNNVPGVLTDLTVIRIDAGVNKTNINFGLASSAGTISGSVRADAGGAGIPGVVIEVFNSRNYVKSVITDASGNYTVKGLTSVTYYLRTLNSSGYGDEYFSDTTDPNAASGINVVQGSTTTNINLYLAAGGSISGTVRTDLGGLGIPDAVVMVVNNEDDEGWKLGLTDSLGNYNITGLVPGTYYLQAFNFSGYVDEYYDNTTSYNAAAPISVAQSVNTANIDFGLALGGSISGSVRTDPGGAAIQGVEVRVYDSGWNRVEAITTTTDALGNYSIINLAAGSYYLKTYNVSGYADEYYLNAASQGAATSVTVTQGADTSPVDFSLLYNPYPQVVTVDAVTDTSPSSWTGANYKICTDSSCAAYYSASAPLPTNPWGGSVKKYYFEPGSYVISVASGAAASSGATNAWKWLLQVFAEGDGQGYQLGNSFQTYTTPQGALGYNQTTTLSIDIHTPGYVWFWYSDTNSSDNQGSLTASVAGAGFISGRVIRDSDGTGISGVTVNAFDTTHQTYNFFTARNAVTDENGNYAITGLASGYYYVGINAGSGYVVEFYDNSFYGNPTPVPVIQPQNTPNINFSLASGKSISGSVISESDGTPVTNAAFAIFDSNWLLVSFGATDSLGNYVSTELLPGFYYIQVNAAGFANEYFGNTPDRNAAVPVAVNQFADTTGIDFSLGPSGTISGRIRRDSDGNGIANAQVNIIAANSLRFVTSATSDASGNYSIANLSPGHYYVATYNVNSFVDEFYGNASTIGNAVSVAVTQGTTTTGIDLSLGAGKSISGTTTRAADGAVMTNVQVVAYNSGGVLVKSVTTAPNGFYSIQGLAPGNYYIASYRTPKYADKYYNNAASQSSATAVTITTANVGNINFSLDAGFSISGSVVRASDGSGILGVCVNAYDSYWIYVTSACSDQLGNYTIEGLVAGDYYLQTSNNLGFADEYFYNATSGNTAAPIAVLADHYAANFVLFPATTETFEQPEVGMWLEYSMQDSAVPMPTSWTATMEIVGTATFDGKTYFHFQEINYDNDGAVSDFYFRMEADKMYQYNGSGEDIVLQLGPVGTAWSVQESDGSIRHNIIVSIGPLNVPYGNYPMVYVVLSYTEDTSGHSSPLVYDYVVPEIGILIKEVDYWTDNAPVTQVLTKLHVPKRFLWRNIATGELSLWNMVWHMNGVTHIGSDSIQAETDQHKRIAGIADFNGDRQKDILWRNSSTGENYVWYMNGTAVTGTGVLPPVTDLTWKIVGNADFNNDGKPDILWRNSSTGENYLWYMNGVLVTGAGVLPPVTDLNWKIVGVADFNNDSKPDILWRNSSTGENYIWYMNGAAVAGSGSMPAVLDQDWKIVGIIDLDDDGRPDIVWRNASTGEDCVWYMNGTNVTGGAAFDQVADIHWLLFDVGDIVSQPGGADFNNDGKPDILWRNTSSGENYIWYMNGAAVTAGGVLPTVADQNWKIVGMADFNNDSKTDILWRNVSTGDNYIWYLNGTAVTGAAALPVVVDQDWKITGIGDFNSDGKPDILWRNSSTGEIFVWYLNGAAVMAGDALSTVTIQDWKIVGVADFNNDGKQDLLWRNSATGVNYVWYLNGTAVTAGGALPTVADQNWQIMGIADFNNDGKQDILWRNTSSGENYIWYMDGVSCIEGVALPTVTDQSWTIQPQR